MNELIKRYKFVFLLVLIDLIIIAISPSVGQKSLEITRSSALEMVAVLPPVFILLGLLDVWVERETMITLMGEKSGFIGIAVAFLLGSAAAGPLYVAFPLAGVLLKKGCRFSNVLIFIGAWSTTKIPMLLFEATAMGWRFMALRFLVDIPGIALIAYLTDKLLNDKEKQQIYDNAVAEI